MEEPSDGLHEKQKHGRYGRSYTSLAFGSGCKALGSIDPNNNHIYQLSDLFTDKEFPGIDPI